MNNQFILNNEPRKHCHLENLGSILVFESLEWLCHSDTEGHCPSQRTQATVCSPPNGQLKTYQADVSGSIVSLAPVFGEPILRPPISLTTGSADKQTVHGSVVSRHVSKSHLLASSALSIGSHHWTALAPELQDPGREEFFQLLLTRLQKMLG